MIADDWYDHAACQHPDVDRAWFFPEKPGDTAGRGKRVCARCPVRRECLLYALTRYTAGVWGGMNERERLAFRRAHRGEDLSLVELPPIASHRADVPVSCPVCQMPVPWRPGSGAPKTYCSYECRLQARRLRAVS